MKDIPRTHIGKDHRNPNYYRNRNDVKKIAAAKPWQVRTRRAKALQDLARSERPYIIGTFAALTKLHPELFTALQRRLAVLSPDSGPCVWLPVMGANWRNGRKVYEFCLVPFA